MKKYLVLLVVLVLFSGCGNKKINSEANFNLDTYKVFEPYKESVSGNYINYMLNNSYDIDNIQARLMDLSKKYFKTTSYYYQAGQYLDANKIKEILNDINPMHETNIDGANIKLKYFSYIHEQNYLDKNGNLAGVSIGLALNKYQAYQNNYGATLYKELAEEELINYAKEQVPKILNYVRSIEELKNTRVIIGLYVSSNPNSILPGSYKYLGITSDNNITLSAVDYNHYSLDSNDLMQKNLDVYNRFKAFKENLDVKDIYVSGYGLFYQNNLVNSVITINTSYLNIDELIYLQQRINLSLNNNFELDSAVSVYIKVNGEIIGIVKKDDNKVSGYILE